MVISRDQQHAAVSGRARRVGVLEDVARAIHAGTFAVPDTEYTVVLGTFKQANLLRAPDGGGSEFFIHAGREEDVILLEIFFGFPQRLVVAAQRRAAVAGNEARSVQPCGKITLPLDHRQSHQRLRAVHEGAALRECVFVVERDGGKR